MREAAEADEESAVKDQELITRLLTENKVIFHYLFKKENELNHLFNCLVVDYFQGLRELLNIYKKYGSPDPPKDSQVVSDIPEVKNEL